MFLDCLLSAFQVEVFLKTKMHDPNWLGEKGPVEFVLSDRAGLSVVLYRTAFFCFAISTCATDHGIHAENPPHRHCLNTERSIMKQRGLCMYVSPGVMESPTSCTRAAEKRITHQSDDDLHRVNQPIRSFISGLAWPVKDIT